MTKATVKTKKRARIALAAVILFLLALFLGMAFYVSDYYRAEEAAIQAFLPVEVEERQEADGTLLFLPEGATVGVIFYPGGKVEHTAYIPLMRALAAQGVLCVLVEMPFRLAVLDPMAAEGVSERFPEVRQWVIGGHSLGGSMAAAYVAEHSDEVSGLFLLAAYSTADLSDSGVPVLSVYGSEDGVMNREKYEAYRKNLPADFSEEIIAGGNHAYFGMYGEQKGDGAAGISPEEQIRQTAAAILAVIERKG